MHLSKAGEALVVRANNPIASSPQRSRVLKFAETLIQKKTQTYCSELQRQILIGALQEERKTYDQLAVECGYSAKYVKQDVAPKLWQLLSQVLDTKVTKANVRAVLDHALEQVERGDVRSSSGLETMVQWRNIADGVDGSDIDELDANESEATELSVHKGTILLVDDQPQNLRLLSELLEEQGYEIQQAISGNIALQAVARRQPDLILLDINMPDVDGYSVCQQLKANTETRDIPVIFVSALDEAWDKVKGFTVGGSDYISKPFKVVEVLARVENQLKIKQLQTTLKHRNYQLQQAIQELQRLAAIDKLTRVASRRRFDAYLLECWQQAMAHQRSLTLMFIQLNHFDIYRQDADPTEGDGKSLRSGDRILQHLAQLIQNTVRTPQSLTSRYGTLTFAIIVPQQQNSKWQNSTAQNDTVKNSTASTDSATGSAPLSLQRKGSDIAQRLLHQIQMAKTPASDPIATYIGLVTANPTVDSRLEDFLAEGDRALQQAKQQTGNCIVSLDL